MGAKCLFKIKVDDNKASQARKELLRRVEAHTGRPIGNWKASCQSFVAKTPPNDPVVVVVLSELPKSRFVVTEKNVIETDGALSTLLEKMPSFNARPAQVVKGTEYELADFKVRVGMIFEKVTTSVTTSPIVEIEYGPCSLAADCLDLVTELMEKIAAPLVATQDAGQDAQANIAAETHYPFVPVAEDFSKYAELQGAPFGPKHAALLYLKLLHKQQN